MKSSYAVTRSSEHEKSVNEEVEDLKIESLHLHNVSVNRNDNVLNNVSLHLESGNIYGFVGNMEKRKMFIDLIHGFTAPTEGNVLVNNVTDIGNIDGWTSYIKLVKKESRLFSEALIGQMILKEKNTVGSITKISLFDATARTLLKASPVLIFDEAMSSLSIELEEELLRQICLKNKNNIVILNTNRPSSLKYCDHIFLIRNNKVSEVSKQAYFSDFSGIFSGFSENYYNESIF